MMLYQAEPISGKLQKFHHISKDMKKLLGSYSDATIFSQAFYETTFQSCGAIHCPCKSAIEESGEDHSAIFQTLKPCPSTVDCQSFTQWKERCIMGKINRRFERFKTQTPRLKLCLLPIGPFPHFVKDFKLSESCTTLWSVLAMFLRIFFTGCSVEILPERDISSFKIKNRVHSLTKKQQYLVTDFFPILKSELPRDCFCVIAVTWQDLYPSEDLNFVLGQGSFHDYSCVASFGRFDPTFLKGFKGNTEGIQVDEMRDIEWIDRAVLWKLLKVVTHETCHVFGLNHCAMFACLMNASTSSNEALNQPMLLCPLCMHKTHHACSSWSSTKNLFEVNKHLASLWQFFKFVFPGADDQDQDITTKRLQSTLHTIEMLLDL